MPVDIPLTALGLFGDAIDFIINEQEAQTGGVQVGGLAEVLAKTGTHRWVSALAVVVAIAIALPAGLWIGHVGKGEVLATSISNVGRAVPELALIALAVAYLGIGTKNLTFVLVLLAIPPILTNTYVAIRQVDRQTVDAAKGVGMNGLAVVTRVEMPLAVPTIFAGIRTSAVNVIATATIAPLVGVLTLGDYILGRNVYGDAGVVAGAICVALLAVVVEAFLAGLQKLLTPRALRSAEPAR
ncbi:MAG: ABC transporter permease, partial [Solirubrobacterales bacterium]